MIILNKDVENKVKKWNLSNIYILTDFDRTITDGSCDSTWGILSKSGLVSKQYEEERNKLFEYYRPIEIDAGIDLETKNKMMVDWWNKHIELFVKYNFEEEVIDSASKNDKVLKFRDGAKEFLELMRDNNVPVIIISAGVGNFIKQFLINNNCDFDNIYILSNFMEFDKGRVCGVKGDIIHSLNKNQIKYPIELQNKISDRKNIVLLGDSISDIKMAKDTDIESALKIGFLDVKIEENKKYFLENFDIVGINSASFVELMDKIKIFK